MSVGVSHKAPMVGNQNHVSSVEVGVCPSASMPGGHPLPRSGFDHVDPGPPLQGDTFGPEVLAVEDPMDMLAKGTTELVVGKTEGFYARLFLVPKINLPKSNLETMEGSIGSTLVASSSFPAVSSGPLLVDGSGFMVGRRNAVADILSRECVGSEWTLHLVVVDRSSRCIYLVVVLQGLGLMLVWPRLHIYTYPI
ncbi:hypothetical protein E2C01_053996 [Portunus trituberculatus]|uniref:Uncharacterized protein n=1 Tax=Portunus trituberculatus TaxID=210409 RepID=A0A5B7GLY6_PORTR|nr:hypothetical protein [Portunus trituberculatus]